MQRKAWPYLAGLLDSEGSFVIGRIDNGFFSRIKIANTEKRLMRWLVQNFGNTFHKFEDARQNRKPYYEWQVYAHQQEAIILGVLPYLLIKKQQALVLLDFRRTENLAKKSDLCDKIQKLNARELILDTPFVINKSKDKYKYAAGFMDGDGCFWKSQERLKTMIHITSKDFVIIKWFLANFGGRFYKMENSSGGAYRWWISGAKNKERFLLSIIPFLELKKKEAISLLEEVRKHKHLIVETTNTQETLTVKKESKLLGDEKSTSLVIEKV